jgi:ketosteroid isomerase-like protein
MSAKKQFNGSADEAEAAFYAALARADLDALMALWADDEEIVCIHPGAARLIGHAAIRASFEAIFERGSVQIHPTQLHATHTMATAVHSVIEQVTKTSDACRKFTYWRLTFISKHRMAGASPCITPLLRRAKPLWIYLKPVFCIKT